jgi:formate dehydrogenase subunit delta
VNQPEKLAAMGNQIAGFFRTQPGDQAAAVADHLVKFWTPAMRLMLSEHVDSGGAVAPLLREALRRLHT